MATVAWTSTSLRTFGDNAVVASWTPLTTTNADGQPFEMPGWADRAVHVFGTAGVGFSLSIQGSNEVTPTNWATLREAGGALTDLMVFTAALTIPDIKAPFEIVRWIRPLVTAGDGATSVTVLLLGRRP